MFTIFCLHYWNKLYQFRIIVGYNIEVNCWVNWSATCFANCVYYSWFCLRWEFMVTWTKFGHFLKYFFSNFRIFMLRSLISSLVHAEELNNIQQNDEKSQVDSGRGLPSVPSSMPNENLPIGSGEKATLYLGTFQILAMPFSPGQIPPNFGNIGTIAPPSKKD